MAIIGPKRWVNSFGKMSIFRLFELLVFLAQKGVFSFQNIVKDIFLGYIPLKKNLEKQPFLDQKHGLNPLEKCQFFDLFELLLFIAQKAVFSFLKYRKRHFLGLYCLYNKLEKWPLLDQNHGLTPLKNFNFSTF